MRHTYAKNESACAQFCPARHRYTLQTHAAGRRRPRERVGFECAQVDSVRPDVAQRVVPGWVDKCNAVSKRNALPWGACRSNLKKNKRNVRAPQEF